MSELVEWYRAQLDEDERVARVAGDHAIRYDPASVLRDVAAKRAILDWAEAHPLTCNDVHWWADVYHEGGHGPHPVANMLASAHSDRPGYRSEWAP